MFGAKKFEGQVEKVLETASPSRLQQLIRSRSGAWVIGIVSFVESALPIPILTDPFLVAVILANRANAARLVFVTTVASVLGGVFAYASAALFFSYILDWMTPAMYEEFQSLITGNEANTFVLTIVGAATPIPYTIVAWVVAVIEGNLWVFIGASILGRGLRYTIVGWSIYKFGPTAIAYAKRYLGLTSILILILVALYVWHKM
ncbi:DedA family protein [Candidatus Kaiserbacteria bacterium]|nr:DedA family protein [Candidatus Kaiserbacteria bacterium]